MAPDALSSSANEVQVLLIEDTRDHAILFEDALSLEPGSHFRVRHAGSLHQGLRLIRQHRFDVIVSDLGLPDATGVTVVPILTEAAPETPLVVLTGNADIDTSLAAIELGASDYVTKGGLVTDTARIVLQAIERHRLRQDLERRTEDVRAFTYGLTHDLKSPLVTIDFLAEELVESVKDSPHSDEAARLIDRIRHAVHTADRLIHDILLFARADSDTLHPRPTDIAPIVRTILDDARERAERKGVRIGSSIPTSCPKVRADAGTFPHLVANLVQNAVKFSPDQDGHVEVRIAPDPTGLRLEVHDNGPGVAPEDRERVFRVFERVHRDGPVREGHGVGLGIVKRIADRHGFEVGITDSPLGGACFHVQMPAMRTDLPMERQDRPPGTHAPGVERPKTR